VVTADPPTGTVSLGTADATPAEVPDMSPTGVTGISDAADQLDRRPFRTSVTGDAATNTPDSPPLVAVTPDVSLTRGGDH
jgi:hypothetical protein